MCLNLPVRIYVCYIYTPYVGPMQILKEATTPKPGPSADDDDDGDGDDDDDDEISGEGGGTVLSLP